MQLLVARPGCAERELLDAVAQEARVRMAVDQAGNCAQPAAVDLHDVAVEWWQLAHPADGGHRRALAEDECVFEQVHVGQRAAA